MILRSLIIVAVLIAVVLVFAATKPDTFLIERSLSIKAPPERIFALINNFHDWTRWAPQDREDPSMKRTFSGPESGTGAVSDWTSTGSAGRGRMLITESAAPYRVSVDADWVKPFKAHNVNVFSLQPDGVSTRTTWSMRGTNVYMLKVMSVFVNMDRMMGKHFETGLENLKRAAEE
ncbi:MAG: SRPBCC family protein [Candidatus Sulfotelmatobacter sp.]